MDRSPWAAAGEIVASSHKAASQRTPNFNFFSNTRVGTGNHSMNRERTRTANSAALRQLLSERDMRIFFQPATRLKRELYFRMIARVLRSVSSTEFNPCGSQNGSPMYVGPVFSLTCDARPSPAQAQKFAPCKARPAWQESATC